MGTQNPYCLYLLLALIPFLLIFILLSILVRPRSVHIPTKGRHVFISGGSSGIGLALARLAALNGSHVSILARNRDKLEEARRSIFKDTGINIGIYVADVRDFNAVRREVEAAGAIDVLVCSHGVVLPEVIEKQSVDEAKFTIDVNLIGTFNLIKAALPGLKNRIDRRPVSVSIVSSQAGQVGIYGYGAYSASKFGLRGLAEALRHEIIMDDIHVSLVFPPDTETPGFEEERKRRPRLTNMIAGSSGLRKAEEVAKKILKGIESGKLAISCNTEGVLLSIATAGLSPQNSIFRAFVEVITAGFVRVVALCFQLSWYRTIAKWHGNNSSNT